MGYGIGRRSWTAAAWLLLAAACSSDDDQGMLPSGVQNAGSGGMGTIAGSGVPIAGSAGAPSVPSAGNGGMGALAGAGGMASVDAGVDPDASISSGPFPRPDVPSVDSLSDEDDGPYDFATYDLPATASYRSGIVYYPTNAEPPFVAVALCPGFTDSQIDVDWWGPRLASHAIVVLILSTITVLDQPSMRAQALEAALETLRAENDRPDSPLSGQIDLTRLGIMGHSMGGGGALLAADALGDEIQAAIPLMPWSQDGSPPMFPNVKAPTMVITGEVDRTARPTEMGYPFYTTLSGSTERAYVEVEGGAHDIGKNPGLHHDIVGRYAIAWLKLHLEDDERYRELIYGMPRADDLANDRLSRFESAP
jgi:dienelactone hydrolase